MSEAVTMQADVAPVEAVLRDELAQGDVVLGTIGPVLGHLLANHDHSLFSDEIVSRVRGMVSDIARQLRASEASAPVQGAAHEPDHVSLTERLLTVSALVSQCHALALEGQLTARLEKRSGIDPVLSPLLQALVASDDAPTASVAMAALAAQARFVQQQRRMELPLSELPADLFDMALGAFATWCEERDDVSPATDSLRREYDESASRIGLLARLIAGMGPGVLAALSLSHAGPAIFLSALAATTHQPRELMVISTNDRQLARLALTLRAAGLKPRDIEEQFLHLHPDIALPQGFDTLRSDRAVALLAASGRVSAT